MALTLTACGGSSSDQNGNEGGSAASPAADQSCAYSAQQVFLEDGQGVLADVNLERLSYIDGKLYATGYSYGFSDAGSHILVNMDPDGTNLKYSMLMGAGLADVLAIDIGTDGNYYVAGVTYNTETMGFTTVTGSDGPSSEHASEGAPGDAPGNQAPGSWEEEEPSASAPTDVIEEETDGPAGPAGAYEEEDLGGGPTAPYEESEEQAGPAENAGESDGPGSAAVRVEEFTTNGEDSPANDPALREEATDGITSPEDEYKNESNPQDAESELVSGPGESGPGGAGTGDSAYILACISSDGQELWTVPAKVPEGAELDYYVNSIAYCKEGILVGSSQGIDLYSSEDGSFVRTVSTGPDLAGTSLYVLQDGTVVTLGYGSSGEVINVLDLQSGEPGESFPIPSEAGMSSLFAGTTYQIYLAGNNAVYGMNLDGTGAVKVIDYVDSDMDITAVTCLAEMEDGKMAAVVADQTGATILEILTKVDPEVIANRKTITLGSYYLDYEVRKQVFAFNKESQDVRISIVDYSKYDGETGAEGMTKLNTDIASGSAPDILVLSGVMPVKSYISKGVFEDLTPYLEKDEEIAGGQYLTNVFDVFKTDGKTFAIIPAFYINAVIGKTEDIGDGSGLTLDLVSQLAVQKGIDPARIFGRQTREDILYQAMEMCGEQFIDWDKSECRFDSDEFIRLLEFIKQFPAKIENTDLTEDTSADYRSGKALLSRVSIGSFDEYVNLKYGVFGTDITMTGFPSQTPGTAVIYPQLEIAVNSSSKEKDACWSFVRRFLLDPYQNSIEMYWPVSIGALDQLANKAMEPLYYTDENGNRVEDHIIMNIGGENIELPRISDSEVDQMYAFFKGLGSEAYFDSSVENIILEESAAFFEGQKSAKDVAGVIQSRVQIYINENS